MVATLNLPVTPSGKSRAVIRQRATVVSMAAVRRPPARLYEVLRLKETASAGEIKAAYRALVKRYHPDVAGSGDGRDFLEIQRAYATLTDPAARARYDRTIRLGFAGLGSRRWETDQCW